ncbi:MULTISPECIES: sulfite exporter TauE/SafE family protein [unclassified Brevundimonas]|uniref:sulfite exporter TauE/SafE family protein n=1 Tax=unclassified Brevundimonas TaxID=2622653 RepID=UPI0025B9BAE7|nr:MULTISPECIES: sulfite exporter TauE/SafE family protein [unclassified Brevundimonas]
MEPIQLLLAALSGGLVALLLTVFGGGGSVLAVPLLIYLVGIDQPHVAIAASAAGVALNGLTALAGQARAGRVRWPCAILFAVVGATFAWAGSSLAKAIDGDSLLLAFAVAMALIGGSMLRPAKGQGDPSVRLNRRIAPRIAVTASGVGGMAGFFGIGGGFLIVPGLLWATNMTLAAAQATSLLSVVAFGASTAINYSLSGLMNWWVVGAMAAGGVFGTMIGLPISKRLGQHTRLGRQMFAVLILLVALYVGWQAIMAL